MLNFKDFKKVDENKKEVHMKHKDGHTIIIAVKSLPKIQQEALKRLPLNKGGVAHYDEGTPDQPVSSDDPKTTPPVTVNVNAPPSPAAAQAATPIQVQQPPVNPANPPVNLPNGSMSAPGAAQTGQQGAQEQEMVDIAKSNAMVPVEQARIQAEQNQAQIDQNRINALATHADNLAENINKVDPDAYRKNMSAPAKVSTALGLFLGGFSVPFGGQNFAQDFLNKQIDRDIDSQKANNENQKTIWGAYNSLYNNQHAASAMAKASMADIYTAQAAKIAQQLGTPQAIANYHKLASYLAVSQNKNILDASGNLSSIPNNPIPSRKAPSNTGQPALDVRKTTAPGVPPQNPPVTAGNAAPGGTSFSDLMKNPDKAETMKESMLGPPKAMAEEIPQAPQKNPVYKILSPDALKKLHGDVQYGPPNARSDYPTVLDQYTKAQQAEKVLNGPKGDGVGGIHDLMQQMYANTGSGNGVSGLPGHIRRETEGGLGSVPYVGPALAAVTGVIPKSEAQKEYDSNKTVMETDLANALQGLVAPTDINKIVEANLPAYLDKPRDIENKTQKIVNMVIKAAKTSQLEQYKMTGK